MKIKTLVPILLVFASQLTLAQKASFTVKDVCEGDSSVFINTSTDATSYIWKFGDGRQSTLKSPKHLYNIGGISQSFYVTLIALSSIGTMDSIIKYVSVLANPRSDFTYTTYRNTVSCKPVQSGNSNYLYIWGDGDSSNVSTHAYTDGLTIHTVCLKVTNAEGCVSRSCTKVTTTSVAIAIINFANELSIYPNPNNGKFTIEIENPEKDYSIEIYNAIGKKIKTIETSVSQSSYNMELQEAPGIYFVKVRNGEMFYFKNMILSE